MRLMSRCILLCHAQVVLNCVDLFIICLNKKNNHKCSVYAVFVEKLMLLFLTTCMQTAETWAEFQFAAFNPQ